VARLDWPQPVSAGIPTATSARSKTIFVCLGRRRHFM
jgi:hypothetical protein